MKNEINCTKSQKYAYRYKPAQCDVTDINSLDRTNAADDAIKYQQKKSQKHSKQR